MIKKLHNCLFLAAVIVALCARASIADSEMPPEAYKVVTNNGKYVFVMHPTENSFLDGKSVGLKMLYPVSGLYTNDDKRTLLWSVDWYSFQVYVSSDGRHVIRIGDWPQGSPRDEGASKQLAIAFYDKGVLKKEYLIRDLIQKPEELPGSVSHFMWLIRGGVVYNDKEGTIDIATEDDQYFIFDLAGNIVSKK